MAKQIVSDKKPLIGFFPLFYNLAETGRSVLIAKHYKKMGGDAIFFSHGGEYEYLAKEIGCEVVRVDPIYTEEYIDLLWKSSRMETLKNPFSKKILTEHVEAEIEAYKKTNVKMIVSTNNFPCIISARVVNIPLIFVTPKVIPHFTKFPDDAEFFFTRIVPESIKLKIANWYGPKAKGYARPFIKLSKKYNTPTPKTGNDVNRGDYTFYTNFPELLGIKKSDIPSNDIYVGPIFLEELFIKNLKNENNATEEKEIEKHIQRDGRSILVSFGSSGTKEFFLNILNALNKTNYNVIAVYTSILQEDELPEVNENIMLKKFVPSMAKTNKMVDLAILHGGQGTVFTALYSGKPVIGFPMQFEQHLNLEMLVKQKMAIIASRKRFKEKDLLKNINEIFDNYDTYLKNAQNLAKSLPEAKGDLNSAEEIIKILEKNN